MAIRHEHKQRNMQTNTQIKKYIKNTAGFKLQPHLLQNAKELSTFAKMLQESLSLKLYP